MGMLFWILTIVAYICFGLAITGHAKTDDPDVGFGLLLFWPAVLLALFFFFIIMVFKWACARLIYKEKISFKDYTNK